MPILYSFCRPPYNPCLLSPPGYLATQTTTNWLPIPLRPFSYLGALGELCGEMCGDDWGDILRGGTGGGSSRRDELGDMRGDPFTGECFACKRK